MSDDLIRKMCRAHLDASAGLEYPVDNVELTAMRAALMILAENVSLEMEQAAWADEARLDASMDIGDVISAAIRKAAE